MSYEFTSNSISKLTDDLYAIGSAMAGDIGSFDETYGLDSSDLSYDSSTDDGLDFLSACDPELHPSWDMAFDSMSTFDADDYEYAQGLMY